MTVWLFCITFADGYVDPDIRAIGGTTQTGALIALLAFIDTNGLGGLVRRHGDITAIKSLGRLNTR